MTSLDYYSPQVEVKNEIGKISIVLLLLRIVSSVLLENYFKETMSFKKLGEGSRKIYFNF